MHDNTGSRSLSLKVPIDRVFDLTDVAEAHQMLELGHTRGKIVLRGSEYH